MKGWKTAIASVLVAAVGAAQGLDWIDLVSDPQTAGWVVAGLGAAMAFLRSITTTPMFKKGP